MAAMQVLTSIGIIVVSFIVGFLFFYVTSSLPSSEKKQQLEAIFSFLINFVIYVWVGKILLNIAVFVHDPLAILAYPSNSHAFYLAALFIIIQIGYKVKRHNLQAKTLLTSFVPIFLIASFVYEFVQMVWYGNAFSWGYLGLLLVLIIMFMLFHERVSLEKIAYLLMGVWCLGQLILAFSMPFTTVFGYMMAPWFLAILFILFFILYMYHFRKRVS